MANRPMSAAARFRWLAQLPSSSPKRSCRPVIYRSGPSGFLYRELLDCYRARDPYTGLTAEGATIPEACGNLRNVLRQR